MNVHHSTHLKKMHKSLRTNEKKGYFLLLVATLLSHTKWIIHVIFLMNLKNIVVLVDNYCSSQFIGMDQFIMFACILFNVPKSQDLGEISSV